MDQQQVKEKYSSYENVKVFFGFSYIAINWICHNFKVEKILQNSDLEGRQQGGMP